VGSQSGVRAAVFAISLVAAASKFALSPLCAIADERFVYRSEEGRFSVDLPVESPSVRELSGSKLSMTDNDVLHSVVSDGAEFAIETHDIPRVAKFLLTSRYILDRSVESMLEDIGAREVDSAKISFLGQPALEVEFEDFDEEFTGRLLLVLADRRLYMVTVQHPSSVDPPRFVAPFFESFSFWLE
jgi:hypothetical protein